MGEFKDKQPSVHLRNVEPIDFVLIVVDQLSIVEVDDPQFLHIEIIPIDILYFGEWRTRL